MNYLTNDEVHRLLLGCTNKRNHLLVNLAWQTGGRVSELLNITKDSFDPVTQSVKFINRNVPIQHDLVTELTNYLIESNPVAKLFPITRIQAFNIIRQSGTKAGLTKIISPHTLRHSFAINCLSQGVPITVVSHLLGHSQLTTTLVYLKIVKPDTANISLAIKF
jgi:integrase/recombinase XerD